MVVNKFLSKIISIDRNIMKLLVLEDLKPYNCIQIISIK